jgi:2',3'-cyclic-nucleotide 2'-phosphodiesterase (5'-nucleotidase family)
MIRTRRAIFWLTLWLVPLSAQETRHLTILHSNDLHAHLLPDDKGMGGFAYLASAVRAEKAHCMACLYLNAGDLVQGTPVSTIYHGDPVYQISNLLGFDAAVAGNHEFDYGWQAIPRFARIAHYPLLLANVLDVQGHPLTSKPYVIETVGGIRVGIIGVVLGDLAKDYSTPELLGSTRVLPVVETVQRYATELRERSDLIVVLGHIHDMTEVDAILRDVPEVQVVIAGHTHTAYPEMHKVDNRVGVLVNGYGTELGRLELDVDMKLKKVESAEWKKIPIDSKKIAPAQDVAREVASWEAKVSKIVDVPIGESKRRLERSDVRAIVEQAMREQTGADFAFVNLGGVRDSLPAGQILARNIWNILPFDDHLQVGTFKGSQLPAAVTRGQTVDPNRDYKLVVSDFTAANQDAPAELNAHGLKFPVKGPLQRDAVIEWVKKKKVIE